MGVIMSKALLDHFETYGYAVVEDLLDPARDLQPLIDDYAQALDEWANLLFRERLVTSIFDSLPFNRRFIALVSESKQPWAQFFDISLPPKDVTEETPIHLSKPVFLSSISCGPHVSWMSSTRSLARKSSRIRYNTFALSRRSRRFHPNTGAVWRRRPDGIRIRESRCRKPTKAMS
jgi:hypothetical protein